MFREMIAERFRLVRLPNMTYPGRNSWLVLPTILLFVGAGIAISLNRNPDQPGAPVPPKMPTLDKLPLYFERNVGQIDEQVRFSAHSTGGRLLFTSDRLVLLLKSSQQPYDHGVELSAMADSVGRNLPSSPAPGSPEIALQPVEMQFVGSNATVQLQAGSALPGKVNYLLGDDPAKWHTNLSTYSEITYKDLYPGVSLIYSGAGGQLKGTYTVAPRADPSAIQWRYHNASRMVVDQNGNLNVTIAGASPVTITEHAPVAWQEVDGARLSIDVRYSVGVDGTVRFALGSYNRAQTLTIDPTLTYSSYIGGSEYDAAFAVAVDDARNIYLTGSTSSPDFPLSNPYQPTHRGGGDAFITKLNPAGNALIYSTYLGGSFPESGNDIVVDSTGSAYVVGYTNSNDFPTANAYQATNRGGYDAFITKLNPAGNALVYSTYLGGGLTSTFDNDRASEIALDSAGHAYVTGRTESTDFPLANPYQSTFGGGEDDAFITKFSPSGSSLVYSSYLGGNGADRGEGIAVDGSGNVYLGGYTSSTNFPTVNAYQPVFAGELDGFVTKLNTTGSQLAYSTYLGGTSADYGRGIAIDGGGNAYIIGDTFSLDFPTVNAYQPTNRGGSDAFVTKLTSTGATLSYSTYLGGAGNNDSGQDIAVDPTGNASVTGGTNSTDFPIINPVQPGFGGVRDAFVTKFASSGSTLHYSTYLGGSDADSGSGIKVDNSGNTYLVGATQSTNFPVQDPYQPTSGGQLDGFVAKIYDAVGPQPSVTPTQPLPTITPGPTSTPVPCTPGVYTDAPPGSTFYPFITCLANRGIVSGYADCTFRPNNPVTRGQLAKMVSNSAGFSEPVSGQTFEDVPPTHTFYEWIERLTSRGYMTGYPCTPGSLEPCVPPTNRPYFRPQANATRGQTAKIVANAALFTEPVSGQTFEDVPPAHTFYEFIQRLANRNVMSGYPCGGPNEPCVSPENRPYFRPGNDVTRGQSAKIVANTFYPNCTTP